MYNINPITRSSSLDNIFVVRYTTDMASENKKGRPQKSADEKRGAVLGFRPTKDVRDLLDRAVETGTAVNLADAVNQAVKKAESNEKELMKELDRAFGGKHNLGLGLLIARLATATEHSLKASWVDNDDVWKELMVSFVYCTKNIRNRSNAPNLDAFKMKPVSESVTEELSDALSQNEPNWWPIADGNREERFIEYFKWLASGWQSKKDSDEEIKKIRKALSAFLKATSG